MANERPVTRTHVRDAWHAAARARERAGDKEGAKRARRAARIMQGRGKR